MYEKNIFADDEMLLRWAKKNVAKSVRLSKMVGWDGAINCVNLSDGLFLLYQLENAEDGWEVCELHMMLWGAEETLREDIFRISKFYRPKGEALWHASVNYGEGLLRDFCVVNAFQSEEYEKYSKGGNFKMTFAGLGRSLECMADKGVVRFYEGNPVEEERARKNDPTIDHADIVISELRSLNSASRAEEPALAEFMGVIESCQMIRICGTKCYRIHLMSGAPASPMSFPWQLLIAANRIKGQYVPRVGDSIHGEAYMFGTFHGDAQKEPTVFCEHGLRELIDAQADEKTCEASEDAASEGVPTDAFAEDLLDEENEKKWEWLPCGPADYPDVPSHSGGLAKSVAEVLPKYVVYGDYRKSIRGELKPLKKPNRGELKRILTSIDYVITSKDNLWMFGSVMESIGIRHYVMDAETGERHLWCCLPSGFGREQFHTNLLVACDEKGDVLRYTFYMGKWDWHRLYRGMDVQICFNHEEGPRRYDSIGAAVKEIGKMRKKDFIVATSLGHTAMVQAYCDAVVDRVQQFTIEWQIHYLPWQFYISKGTCEQVVAMLEEFDRHGIEPVETMARWKWCKMAGNV